MLNLSSPPSSGCFEINGGNTHTHTRAYAHTHFSVAFSETDWCKKTEYRTSGNNRQAKTSDNWLGGVWGRAEVFGKPHFISVRGECLVWPGARQNTGHCGENHSSLQMPMKGGGWQWWASQMGYELWAEHYHQSAGLICQGLLSLMSTLLQGKPSPLKSHPSLALRSRSNY